MSFVNVTPELIEEASQNLAGIRSSLAEAADAAMGPTTGVAAAAGDEVSAAIAALFGNVGQQFQALSAQAQAFHGTFVAMLNAGAGAYLSTEAANAAQTTPAAVLDGVSGFGATVAAPYQALVSNTVNNLQSLGNAIAANPAPVLRQFALNQQGYGQAIVTGVQSVIQNPAQLAGLPAALQTGAHGALPAVQNFLNTELAYGPLITTSLQNAQIDFMAGVNAFPANLQAGLQTIMSGDVTGGLSQVGGAFLGPFITSLNAVFDPTTGLIDIVPSGALGDVLPLAALPAQTAQNITNLIPAGTVPGMVAQNATNVFATLTDTSQTLDLNTGNLHIGLPLVLALDALGPPVTTVQAIGSSANALVGAVQTGDGLGALAAVLDAPAVAANGFLNGQATLQLPAMLGGPDGILTLTDIPLGGLLTPLNPAALEIPIFGPGSITLHETTFGGIVPGLLVYLPEQLARAIGAPPLM
ncbi:PE family protein [Mycobacterium sp. Marseille-P9652]|uniref:PE family protein n=1 Tax=Mycobacterium sp. Marseille-P9652 TaxID=2654950 RepID=UPI0012E7ECBF|nr:PE family protein [Mycobacterium sp. Marseille-P9652]